MEREGGGGVFLEFIQKWFKWWKKILVLTYLKKVKFWCLFQALFPLESKGNYIPSPGPCGIEKKRGPERINPILCTLCPRSFDPFEILYVQVVKTSWTNDRKLPYNMIQDLWTIQYKYVRTFFWSVQQEMCLRLICFEAEGGVDVTRDSLL